MTDRNVAADRSRYTDYSAVTASHTGSAGCSHSADRTAVAYCSHLTANCTVLAVEYSCPADCTAPAADRNRSADCICSADYTADHTGSAGRSHSADYCTVPSGRMHLSVWCSTSGHIHLTDCTACSARTYLADCTACSARTYLADCIHA